MPKPYSNDLRDGLVRAVGRGLSARRATGVFGVSVSSAIRWTRRMRRTGSAAFRPTGGNRRSRLTAQKDWLLGLIREQPDLTLTEIQRRLGADKAIIVGYGTVWRFFAAQKISDKKSAARRRTGTRRRGRGPRGLAPDPAVA